MSGRGWLHDLASFVLGATAPSSTLSIAVRLAASPGSASWLVVEYVASATVRGDLPPVSFGARVAQLRSDALLTLQQLGERVSLHGSYVSDIEHGRKPPPPPEQVRTLAQALGVEPARELVWLAAVGRDAVERPPGLEDALWATRAVQLVAIAEAANEAARQARIYRENRAGPARPKQALPGHARLEPKVRYEDNKPKKK